jgi:hypothetical protein
MHMRLVYPLIHITNLDDHFMSALFCAGAAGAKEDEGTRNTMKAECWELVNMCNTQFQLGEW